MISSWPHHGIWGDDNTPVPAATFVPLVGAWTSYLVDVTEGVERLGEVTDGHLYWNARLPKGSAIIVDVLVNDEGEWQRDVLRGEAIVRAREWNDTMPAMVRIRLRVFSSLSDVRAIEDAAVRSLAVVLSRRGAMAWQRSSSVSLGWRDGV